MLNRTYLPRNMYRKLEDMVLEKRLEIEKGDHTFQSFATLASVKLGSHVTPAHVKAASDVMQVTFPSARNRASMQDHAEVKAAVVVIAKELVELLRTMGEPVSIELLGLAES